MESRTKPRFSLGRQSSLAPERDENLGGVDDEVEEVLEGIDPGVRLMYLANEGDLEAITELLDSGTNVNFKDIDGRTALHVAACQGLQDAVELLLRRGAEVDVEDRWGSTYLLPLGLVACYMLLTVLGSKGLIPETNEIIVCSISVLNCATILQSYYRPLADAIFYKNHDVIKLLEEHGAKPPVCAGAKPTMAPMHVENVREVPEYEINPHELDFTNSVNITKGTFRIASWRGIQVAVKLLGEELFTDEDKVKAFRDELALLQKMRHPNVVQFLGAVTQSSPMMIVTEYLPKGDLHALLKRKGALKPITAVKYALDIARGMNYLHEHKPEAIIHRDLEPSNVLRDDSGHLKVADFGVSKLLKVANTVKEDKPVTCQDTSWRYVAPEVFRNEEYDTKVDVFSFALILQEMIEGCPPFSMKQEIEVPKAYVAKQRPPFRASPKLYAHGLRELIEACWSDKPFNRPTFAQIIVRLEHINNQLVHKRRWKLRALKCFEKLEAALKLDHSSSSCSGHSSCSTIR